MAYKCACLILQHVVLPAILIFAALMRPTVVSFVYIVMFCISPFIATPNIGEFKGSVVRYLIGLLTLSVILSICHVGLNVTEMVLVTKELFTECTFSVQLLRHVGFIGFKNLGSSSITLWILPEILTFSVTLIVYTAIKKLTITPELESGDLDSDLENELNFNIGSNRTTKQNQREDIGTRDTFSSSGDFNRLLISFSPAFCLAALFFAASLRPSLIGSIYFVAFLGIGTYWACFRSLKRKFVNYLCFMLIVLFLHGGLLVVYQTPWLQEYIPHKSLIARLLSLEPLVKSSCDPDIRVITYNMDYNIDSYLSPVVIYIAYYILALTIKHFFQVELIRALPFQRQSNNSDIALDSLDATAPQIDESTGIIIYEQIVYVFSGVYGFIYQNSYIFTNVLMMVWSIVYHSWLTFVLLLSANILWMAPDQRKAMLRSSISIVCYAEILLLIQYIYSLNLTNQELPDEILRAEVNLKQIGLRKPQDDGVAACVPLIVKTSFLIMFWVTMRQYFQEKSNIRRINTFTDVLATLQLAVTGQDEDDMDTRKSKRVIKLSATIFKNFVVRLWIWIMLLVIFICAMYGDHMTGFRICYMALFLFFLLVLQISGRAWLRIMYGFWLFLIFYAMFILTIIYTYQFDKFDQYWMNLLVLSPSMQEDIGLHRDKTKDLFLHLLPPTTIIILTVIQVHYFHARLVHATKNQPLLFNGDVTRSKNKSQGRSTLFYLFYKSASSKAAIFLKLFKDVLWRLLEIYWIKLVYIAAFICCAKEQTVLNIPLFICTLLGAACSTKMKQIIMRLMSLLVAITVLSKMIYQVAFVEHSQHNVHCPKLNSIQNNALWFGLSKATKEVTMMSILKCHLIYMVMATLQAIIIIRQNRFRRLIGDNSVFHYKVPFPNISYKDAEVNFKGLLKYIANYGFYKFGYEISLICLTFTIAYRRDIVSLIYSVWLLLIISVKRKNCARFWIFFQIHIVVSLLIQYIILIGFPPSLCLIYPWEKLLHTNTIQYWAMLPGQLNYDHSNKLILEFLLLLVINRQGRVYNVERIPNFPGGSNSSVLKYIKNMEKITFVNPTHDFLTNMRNYLDVFKHAVFCGFYWITLTAIFLAGTQISDVMSLGYIIGAFIFLWEGSDLYLRPITSILRRWRILLIFNVCNITMKTWLQMAGCLYIENLRRKCCWFVHLFGINCVSQDFEEEYDTSDYPDDCPETSFDSVVMWDAICFSCLILQYRIFRTYYFCHIIKDTKATNILATRGADIIEQYHQRQIAKLHEHEENILKEIKRKMEKIRANQQKLAKLRDKVVHFDEHGNPILKHHRDKAIKSHPDALLSGDYYMFEHMDEQFELDIIPNTEELFENDNENITNSEIKMNRRKAMHKDMTKAKSKLIPADEKTASTSKRKSHRDSVKSNKNATLTTESDDDSVDFDANPITRLLENYLVLLTIRLNRFSRYYRYVNKILEAEKKALKESRLLYDIRGTLNMRSTAAIIDMLRQSQTVTAPSTSAAPRSSQVTVDVSGTTKSTQTTRELELEYSKEFDGNSKTHQDKNVKNKKDPNSDDASRQKGSEDFDEADFTSRDHNILVEVLISSWYAILSNTELICYIWVIVHQIFHASLLSLPLPFMVFLWGTLAIPRPSKTFWITLIAYTEAGILIKCVFQFELFWANYHQTSESSPFGVDKIVGVDLNPHYATSDLIFLLLLFFHRYVLKTQGLWKNHNNEDAVRENNTNNTSKTKDNLKPDKLSPTSENDSKKFKKLKKKRKRNRYLLAFINFFANMKYKERLSTDVYVLMFFCDFINFFVLLFGFTDFGHKHLEFDNLNVQDYIAENKVPIPFLLMLLVQFGLIVIDRALYLRKAIVGKIIFHIMSVIAIHIWLFFLVPLVTEKNFYDEAPPIIYYIIKCFYLLFSAYQIRCGYPKRISGNFLTKGFSPINMVAFKIYLMTPFLYELRTILDWLCTDTTFTIIEWLKMEDIFANIYLVKCCRQMEIDFPSQRGIKREFIFKCLLGGVLILTIVAVIWGPLTMFALFNAVGQPNTPKEVRVQIRIGSYDAIYTYVSRESVRVFNEKMYKQLLSLYAKDSKMVSLLEAYDPEDIAAIKLNRHSSSMWDISPPDRTRLIQSLESSNKTIVISLSYKISRKPPVKGESAKVSNEITYNLNKTYPDLEALIEMLKDKNAAKFIHIPQIVPKFIKITSGNAIIYMPMFMKGERFHGLSLILNEDTEGSEWWDIVDYCGNDETTSLLKKLPYFDCTSGVVFYTFNDKQIPQTWAFLTAGGIIGLYTTFVLLFSRFIKSFSGGYMKRIPYEDLPYVDRVLQLCLDIYLVREAKEFILEEDLFAKLLFLFRSPETLIKWTRRREIIEEHQSNTESVHGRNSTRR